MMDRRTMLRGTAAALAGLGLGAPVETVRAAGGLAAGLEGRLAEIAAQSGGRLGVAVLDVASGARAGHAASELFPLCSTFKVLAVGAVLVRVDAGEEQLGRRIRFTPDAVVANSPVTGSRAGREGLSLDDLCGAALTMSDNTAANLILAALGGPSAVTAFARRLGDRVTRLDRTETALNEAIPGDPRDTSTPLAMLENLKALTLGPVLSAASRDRLLAWLKANRTGDARLRARLPAGWQVGDKTGSGDRGTANDLGLLWPPGRPPILVATYLTECTAPPEHRNATIAAIGEAVAAAA